MPGTQIASKPHRVLVVDDDPSTLRLLEVVLKDQGLQPVLAQGSIAAQSMLQDRSASEFDCALVDYRMPGMNGLEFVAWLLSIEPEISTVLMTAEGDIDLVTGALRQGVVDYVEKPFRRPDLYAALNKAATLTEERRYRANAAEGVRDMTLINDRLVPHADMLPSGFAPAFQKKFERAFLPVHEAGGDFVNCFPIDRDRLLIVAGDVSGHDLKAGFISSYFQGMCRGMIAMQASIEEVRAHFNKFLCDEWNVKRKGEQNGNLLTSLSVCFVLLDFSRMRLVSLNNGFPIPLLYGQDLSIKEVGSGGPPLGWFQDPETEKIEMDLPESGTLTLFSDGIVDQATQVGVDLLALSDRLLKSEQAEMTLEEQRDDVLVIRLSWGPAQENQEPMSLIYAGSYRGSAVDNVDGIQKEWKAALLHALPECPNDRLLEVLLCCREALLNAMLHGSQARPDRVCKLTIGYRVGSLHIRVEDEGSGYDTEKPASPAELLANEHVSLGLQIIRSYADRCETERRGATLRMEFSIGA